MTAYAALSSIINEKQLIKPVKTGKKLTLTLEELGEHKVVINRVHADAFAVKLDVRDFASGLLNQHCGLPILRCCDFVIVCPDVDGFLFVELGSNKAKRRHDALDQFRGGQCRLLYLLALLDKHGTENQRLDHELSRFVLLSKRYSTKQPISATGTTADDFIKLPLTNTMEYRRLVHFF